MQPHSSNSNNSALGKRKLPQDHTALVAEADELKQPHAPNSSDSESDGEQSPSDDGGYRGEDDEEEEELVIDRKHLLIVKDGTIRVAESLEQQQFDANGEAIKASGTWTKAEHDRFLKATEMYPKGPWKAIAAMIGTRTVRQTQTHAQKYREKMARRMRGLRNRNGTLQYMYQGMATAVSGASDDGAVVFGFSDYAMATDDSSRGGTVVSHDRVSAVYEPASAYTYQRYQFPHEQFAHAPQARYHVQPVYHQVVPVQLMVAHPHHPVVASSMEFAQLNQQSGPSAYASTAAHSASWSHPQEVASALAASLPPSGSVVAATAGGGAGGSLDRASLGTSTPSSAEFDESMDFLMHMYAGHPSQGNSAPDAPAAGFMPDGHQQLHLHL